MPPRASKKRKATPSSEGDSCTAAIPDRATWTGWVEMESEPAFFNVMLRDMGAEGLKMQEVYALDDEMLAILPQPVHALIFLFKYKDFSAEDQETTTSCPDGVWFANQVPDFACATIALLNTIYNIPGLSVGKELQDFAALTETMSPLERGDAVDSFDFVKHVHNSFAREVDIMNADMHLRNKAAKANKRAAAKKAAETRKAKAEMAKNAKEFSNSRTRGRRSRTPQADEEATPSTTERRTVKGKSGITAPRPKPTNTSTRSSARVSDRSPVQPTVAPELGNGDSDIASPSSKDRIIPGETKQTSTTNMAHEEQTADSVVRRSKRTPQPRKDLGNYAVDKNGLARADDDEEGFHFIAYMPIGDHVWKLDGMDSYPTDLGSFSPASGGSWMNVAKPALQARMLQYEADEIQFNLMAMCHDALADERMHLLGNVHALQAAEKKLDEVFDDWREMDGGESTCDLVKGMHAKLEIAQVDIDGASSLVLDTIDKINGEKDLLALMAIRQGLVAQQSGLRAAVRDALELAREDDEKARHRRHDYGGFVRGWLGALADNELLTPLLEAT